MWKRLTFCLTCGHRGSKRSGSPEKLTNISLSCESDSPESFVKKESGNKQTNSAVKPNSFGHKNEGAQGFQSDGSEQNITEGLRQRLSAKKSQDGQDTVEEPKANSTESNDSNDPTNNSSNLEKELINESANEKNNLVDVLPVSKQKEVRQGTKGQFEIKTIGKTNNVEISHQPSGNAGIAETFESSPGDEDPTHFVEHKIVQDVNADSLKATDKTQEKANINNDNGLLTEPLARESNDARNDVQKAIKYSALPEEEAKVTEVISSETAFELKEESGFYVEGGEGISIKEQRQQPDIAGDRLNDYIHANDSTKPLGIEEINNSGTENCRVEQIDNFVADDVSGEEVNGSVAANARIEQIDKFVVDNSSVEEINKSVAENARVEQIDEFIINAEGINDYGSAGNEESRDENASVDQILEPHVNEVRPVIDNVIEKFSDRLSKHILEAVLQDTQLLYSQSEDEQDEIHCKESVLKFSDILAESIVRSVVDYSKVSQAHFSEHDEHDPMSPNVVDVCNKTNENTNQDVAYESSPPNEEDIFSADEGNDESCCRNLHEYAKRLSQHILSDVLDLSRESTSSTHVYASKLTETVLSNAIHGARSRISDSRSLTDSDMGVESAIDLFITEIVGNAVESAISRIEKETYRESEEQNVSQDDMGEQGTCRDSKEQNLNQGDVEGQNGMGEHSEDLEEHVDNLVDNEVHLEMHNGEIDSPNEDMDHKQNGACGSNSQPIQQNGKLQSKWLSEDDLDELYDDDLSDEDEIVPGDSSKPVWNSTDDKEIVTSPNCLTIPNNDKQFQWRKSLIEDLDDDFDDLDEIETPRSSMSSSPTKSGNFADLMIDGSVDSDDEVLETSFNGKVQAQSVMTTDPSRSRLRSVDTTPVLVIDNGSAFLKVGFSDQALPKQNVHSVVGTPLRYSQDISGMEYSAQPGRIYGDGAMGKAGVLHIEYPLKSDLVEKWSDVEGLWNYVLGNLMCIQDNPDFPVLISQPALNPKKNTEKIAEIMFEHFHMPSIFIADQLALSLFSMGYTSGLSFCSGFKSTQAGVVYEGHVLPHTVKQLDIAGYQLTENLKKLLMSLQGFGFRSSSQWQIVDDIKKKLGYFSLDFAAESKRYKTQAELQTAYELPDGQVIEVGLERFGCAESLFRPMELGLTQSPAHMLIIEAINSCEEELQELCYKAMGVSGGTTQMNGFLARLEQELREHDRKFKNFTAPEHRDVSTWLGGSVVASLPTFREMVVTVDEYAESGARVVHSKCF